MHGLQNDFVVIDKTKEQAKFDHKLIKRIACRKTGIGCDQVIILEKSIRADIKMVIFNSDGSMSEACGNATRCVAKYICTENKLTHCKIELANKISSCKLHGDKVSSTMGKPTMEWQHIPLAKEMDCLELDFNKFNLPKPVVVNISNPHVVFFIDNINKINIADIGPKIESDPLFPNKINVSFARVRNDNSIELSVWERGAGMTAACGTAACATAYAAIKRNLIKGHQVKILFKNGSLAINLLENGDLEMIGDANETFVGRYFYD
ncbi:MAG: diaminopimelate epimerase [Rickettsiales bacterium]